MGDCGSALMTEWEKGGRGDDTVRSLRTDGRTLKKA